MNIAYLLRFWPTFGGGETVTRLLANELCNRGHNIYIYYLWDRTNNLVQDINPKIVARKVENISDIINDGEIQKRDYKSISNQFHKFYINDKIDIVVNQWIPAKICLNSIKNQSIKLITCNHGLIKYVPPVLKTLKQKIFYTLLGENAGFLRIYWQYKPSVLKSDRYVCLCEPYVKDIKKLYSLKNDARIIAVPNPCTYNILSNDCIQKKRKEIIYVGRAIELKRINLLIDAWKIIEDDSCSSEWNFTIIGDGPTLENNKQYAEELGCKHINFEGFKEPKAYYERSSIFIFASCQEGWGMVLVEAQANGCIPVVMDSSPCFHVIIDNSKNGFIVKDGSVKELSEKVLFLMKNDTTRKEIALSAIESSKQYHISNIVDTWEKIFNECLVS